MRRTATALLALALAATATAAEAPTATTAQEIATELARIARSGELWPGYRPLATPLAVYDGERTWLFRHPSPPEGFTAVDGSRPEAWAMPGRHPAVTANSSAEIGGRMTGTLLADGERAGHPANALAAVALHEIFHVFQRQHHPDWVANEGDLLRYPFEDAEQLAYRRLETRLLGWALAAEDEATTACRAALALHYRNERFAAIDPAFAAYERANELNEGLASYVQIRARGESGVEMPADGWPATALRDRFYTVGPALAFLLDRLRPGWAGELEADDTRNLDGLLAEAAKAKAGQATCRIDRERTMALFVAAKREVEALQDERRQRRQAFEERPGRVVVIAAEGAPLWPQRFDPLNVEHVAGGLLHTRYVRLGNDAGAVQIVDEAGSDLEALTEAAGEHPLFNGVARVEVAGLEGAEVEEEGGEVTIRSPGLEFAFSGATVERYGDVVMVRLERPAG